MTDQRRRGEERQEARKVEGGREGRGKGKGRRGEGEEKQFSSPLEGSFLSPPWTGGGRATVVSLILEAALCN